MGRTRPGGNSPDTESSGDSTATHGVPSDTIVEIPEASKDVLMDDLTKPGQRRAVTESTLQATAVKNLDGFGGPGASLDARISAAIERVPLIIFGLSTNAKSAVAQS